MHAAISVLIAVLAQASSPPPVNTATAKTRAQALLSEGAELYERGQFGAALTKFEAAYAIFPSPKLLFNIGQAERDLGQPIEAVVAFEHFLSEAKDASPATLAEARRSIADLRTKLGRISIDCPTRGVLVTIDGHHTGTTPLAEPVWLTPGSHQIALGRPDLVPVVKVVTVVAGSMQAVPFQLRVAETPRAAPAPVPVLKPTEPAPAPAVVVTAPTQASERPPLVRQWWFWGAVGAGVVLTVVIIAASSGGGSDVPQTTLGAQNAFQ